MPRRVALVWTIGTVLFAGLALGPYLHLHGSIHRHWWLPLPYRLLSLLGPLGNMYHGPAYFWVLALFGIWTLAAFGLGWLLNHGDRRGRWALAVGIVGWLAIDYGSPPLSAFPVSLPDVYQQIAADPGPASVLELPTDKFLLLEEYNAGQAVHHKPLARGFLARTDVAVRRRDEMIEAAQSSSAGLQALLDELGPTYVVVREQFVPPARRRSLLDLLARHGPEAELVSGRDGVVAYRLKPSRPPARSLPSPVTRNGAR